MGVDEDKRTTLRRFAALGAAAPFTRLVETPETGSSDARDAIAGYVAATPGAHFSKIRDDLHLGTGETQHHIRRLLDANVIESRRDGDYRRIFPTGQFTEFEQIALGYLRRDTPRGMILELLRNPAASGTDLADTLAVSRPTISKYAAELAEAGLIERNDGYELVAPENLLVLLVRYADSFDTATTRFATDAPSIISVDQ